MDTKVQLLIIIAVLNILFSLFLIRDNRSLLRVLFSLVTFFVGLWALSLSLFVNTTNLNTALLASIFYYLCAAAIPLLFFYFSVVFVKNKPTLSLKYLLYLLPFSYFTINFLFDHNFIIKDIHFVEGITKDIILNNKHYIYYSVYFISYIALSYFVLLRATVSKELGEDRKKQLKIIILGTSISYILAIVPNLLLPYFGNYQLVWLGPLFTIIMVSSIAYAILKYHLFNIKLIIVELAILLLNLFLFLNVFTSHAKTDLILNVSVSVAILAFSIVLIRGIYKDIRDRERIEGLVKDMEVANEKLRMLEGQKTEFVSIASHQLRTPLTVIKGYASMILEGTFGHINDQARDAMEKLYKSSERIVALVEDLLTVSRIEQGRMMLNFERVNFKDFIHGVIGEMENEISESKIDLSFTAEDEKEFFVSIDEKKFKQVVKHILENAIKYTPEPGSVRVAVLDDSLTKKVRLTVSDTGIGMTQEQVTAIFERFNLKAEVGGHATFDEKHLTQEEEQKKNDDAEAKMMEKRTPGIGLYIVQEIVEAHHGTLRIESAGADRGTTVVVELPKGE
ncbi:MAG TPA: hypothetical protein DCS23_01620 [Candidatus Yonathbacteria bacterium]|nr:hypothetical protein [Candidatus Yonathbacteria bacterium]